MLFYRSKVNRFFIGATLAGAMLANGALGVPAAGANPAAPTSLPGTTAVTPSMSSISVQPGGTDAWVTFTSAIPSTATVAVQATGAKEVAPVMVATGSEPAGHHPIGGVGAPVATLGAVSTGEASTPVYETSHKMHLTNLKPGTAYDASVSASTQGGEQLSSQVHFDTLQERVRISVDNIDLTHGGALFGDNTVWWVLGVDWGLGSGYHPVNSAGSVSTCFPSNDSGDPTGHVVGVCQTGSYGDGTFTPLNNRGHQLSWVFAQENFDSMPTTFTLSGSANEQDFFSPGQANPDYPRGCKPTNTTTVPLGMGAQSTTISVCGDDPNSTFQSLITYKVEVFYDNATYQAPGRNTPTSPWS